MDRDTRIMCVEPQVGTSFELQVTLYLQDCCLKVQQLTSELL